MYLHGCYFLVSMKAHEHGNKIHIFYLNICPLDDPDLCCTALMKLRHGKCHGHCDQQSCKIFRAWVNF